MVIAIVANRPWYKYMIINIYALLRHTKDVKKIYILTETCNVNEIPYLNNLINKYSGVEFKVLDARPIIEKNVSSDCANKNSFFTQFAMVKLMLADVVKEDKVLYIDTDAIVRADISNVWKYNIDNYYIAGVRDFGILKRGVPELMSIAEKYINSGFVIFNLKKIRADFIKEKLFEIINNKPLRFPDQDALNLVCNQKVFMLPSMYNVCEDVTQEVVNKSLAKVYHYAGIKDFWVANRLYAEEWYDEEEKFYEEFEIQ